MREILRKFALGTAAVTCPCHLPIYLALLGGTALGSVMAENRVFTFGLLTVVFLLSLGAGLRMAKARGRSPEG